MCLGIPARIVSIRDEVACLAVADVAGVRRLVNMTCVLDDQHSLAACVGDWVLIHAGFAMARIDEAEARKTLALMEEIGALQDELGAIRDARSR